MANKNFPKGTVLTAPSPTTSGTSLILNSGQGALFPDPATEGGRFPVTIYPAGSDPSVTNAEVAIVTAISGDTLTIIRAQEGTSARDVQVGDRVHGGVTAYTWDAKPDVVVSGSEPAAPTSTHAPQLWLEPL